GDLHVVETDDRHGRRVVEGRRAVRLPRPCSDPAVLRGALRTWQTRWVPCRRRAPPSAGPGLPQRVCWFTLNPAATHRVEHSNCRWSAGGGEAPLDSLRPVETHPLREGVGRLELVPARLQAVVDHLGQESPAPEADLDLGVARQDRLRHAERAVGEHESTRRPLGVARGAARRCERVEPASARCRNALHSLARGRAMVTVDAGGGAQPGQQCYGEQEDEPLGERGQLLSFRTFKRRPSSSSCSIGTSDGAPLMGSTPAWFFGNAITSLRLGSRASTIVIRSMPNAMPPIGGAPIARASSRNPNFACCASRDSSRRSKTFACSSGPWIPNEPPPSSFPFTTTS